METRLTERRLAAIMAADVVSWNVGTFQLLCPMRAVLKQTRVHCAECRSHISARLPSCHNQEVDVAGMGIKSADSERAIQVQANELLAKDALNALEQAVKHRAHLGKAH